MRKWPVVLLIISAALFSGVAGYTIFKPKQLHISNTTDLNIISVDASWGIEYPNIKELIQDSDVVVIARLNKELGSYQPFDGYSDTFTDAEIVIDKVLKGNNETSLKISQYGGVRKDGRLEAFNDLPLLESNRSYLMFLERIQDNSERNNKYQYVGGIQGFYLLEATRDTLKNINQFNLVDINEHINISAPLEVGITKTVSDAGLDVIIKEIEATK